MRKSNAVIIGWIILLVGTALWIYGYFATGNPSLIDWRGIAPWWIADYLPNIESEIGMVLVFATARPDRSESGFPKVSGGASLTH